MLVTHCLIDADGFCDVFRYATGVMARFTDVEQGFDDFARRLLAPVPTTGPKAWLAEFLVFGVKQAWACVFGAALLVVLIGARLWYPEDAALARNDFLTIAAVVIQIVMVVARLETLRELRVIILFHLVGTGMELFKTSFGSFMVRSYRLMDLAFTRYPPR